MKFMKKIKCQKEIEKKNPSIYKNTFINIFSEKKNTMQLFFLALYVCGIILKMQIFTSHKVKV